MVRARKGEIFIHKNLTLEAHKTAEYEELFGPGMLSENIRKWIEQEIDKAKKAEAPKKIVNPLGLPNYNINPTLISDITIDKLCDDFEDSVIENIKKEINRDTGLMQQSTETLNRIIKIIDNEKKMLFKEDNFLVNGKLMANRLKRIEILNE